MTHLESLTEKLHALLPELKRKNIALRGAFGEVHEEDQFHPITLEHVLKAAHLSKKRLTASCCGKIAHTDANTEHRYYWWVLGLPLHKQSPDLWQFLDNLLPEPNEE